MRPKIYLFGDSITELSFQDGGWGASLATFFSRSADVVLRGYGGYNTRWALKVLNKGKVFPQPETDAPPLAVTVFFGANDASLPDAWSAHLYVPLDEYKQNLHSIVSFLKKRWPTTNVILITPPPIDEAARVLDPYNKVGRLERTNESAGNYAKACVAVGAELGIPTVDLWSKMQQTPAWGITYLSDGVHLTPAGNRVVSYEVIKRLEEAGVNLETLPYDLPNYSQLEPPNDALKVLENY